jgi:small-conductance mechanosensitive channel
VAIFIFLLFLGLAKGLKKVILKLGRTTEPGKARIVKLLGSIVKTITIIIGTITAMETLGIDVTALIAGLGLTGFALSFALKDALSNILAGILLLFYQPFGIGDRITVTGCEGEVVDINLRYTNLKGTDKIYLIPNSTCFSNWVAINEKKPDEPPSLP